jgi:cell volume regulation protein A
MHELAPVIIFVGVLVFAAHFFVFAFERTRVPDILFLIAIGIVVGPVLNIVQTQDFGKLGGVFTTIALVVILFEGGLEIGVDSLKSSWRGTILITVVSFVIALVLLFAVLLLLGQLSLGMALFVAAVLAGPAPSVVIPLVRQLKVSESLKTTMVLESPLGEAISIVAALAILQTFKMTEVEPGRLLGSLFSSFIIAFVIGAVGGYFWSTLLHQMRQLRNAIFTTPSFVFIVYGVSEFFGFSGPVASLTFGIILGNVEAIKIPWLVKKLKLTPMVHNEVERQFFGEIVFLLKAFFFVYLGLTIRFSNPWILTLSLVLVLALLLSRFLSVRLTLSHFGDVGDAMAASVLIPRGIAAAVLAFLPLQMGIEGGEVIRDLINSAVIVSILATGFMTFGIERTSLATALRRFFPRREQDQRSAGE